MDFKIAPLFKLIKLILHKNGYNLVKFTDIDTFSHFSGWESFTTNTPKCQHILNNYTKLQFWDNFPKLWHEGDKHSFKECYACFFFTHNAVPNPTCSVYILYQLYLQTIKSEFKYSNCISSKQTVITYKTVCLVCTCKKKKNNKKMQKKKCVLNGIRESD